MWTRRRTDRWDGARCLVTGASSGLGRAIAGALARRGARVLLTGRDGHRLAQAVGALVAPADGRPPVDSGRVASVAADLTDPGGRERVMDAADTWFGGALDLLVNCAGVGAAGHFDTHDATVPRDVFEVNVFALIELTRLALPRLRRGTRPSVLNVGSVAGRRGIPGRTEYSASKFAVAGFTEALRAEWVKFGIRVTLLNPGWTATEFEANHLVDTARYKVSRHRKMAPDAVAVAALRALERGKAEATLTAHGRLLLLVNRVAPRVVDRGFALWTRHVFGDVTSGTVPAPAPVPPPHHLGQAPSRVAPRARRP